MRLLTQALLPVWTEFLLGEPNIREVIAFPMNKNAQDLLMNAPSEVTELQLKEVGIRLADSDKK